MYDTLWQTIQGGDYRLEDILHKIDVFWVEGQITQEQREELIALALEHLDPESERPELETRLETLAAQVAALADRVTALEESGSAGEDPGGQEEPDYPDWQPWDGMSQNYPQGAIVRHNGQLWISTFSGQNVWEPGLPGTEALWQAYSPET